MSSRVTFRRIPAGSSPEQISAAVAEVYEAAGLLDKIRARDLVAMKTHFGEEGNRSFIKPHLLKGLVAAVEAREGRPFWTDTNTLYTGPRANARDHTLLAHRHGFTIEDTGIPVIIADGIVGREEHRVRIDARHSEEVGIATGVAECDNVVVITHPTGHLVSGFGATIKNVGMGLSSRKGKLYQHSVVEPWIKEERCLACGACLRWCPVGAISMRPGEKARIDPELCYGCGECLAACRVGAVSFAWQMASEGLQERMAEQALGVVKHMRGRMGFVSLLIDFAHDCDCLPSRDGDILVESIGVAASADPVALDAASADLIEAALQKSIRESAYDIDWGVQLRYAEELGLGTREYELVEV